MKKMMLLKIFKYLCLIGYIISIIVLISESCMNGTTSGAQSNVVGEQIMNIINDITVSVEGKPLINDVETFMLFVRKAIGHFGAFLVFGIFSSLTYLLFVKDIKKWKISVPICFIQGFILALITELIQHYVPGRYGAFSDVLLDYSGFLVSSIIISALFILITLKKQNKMDLKK